MRNWVKNLMLGGVLVSAVASPSFGLDGTAGHGVTSNWLGTPCDVEYVSQTGGMWGDEGAVKLYYPLSGGGGYTNAAAGGAVWMGQSSPTQYPAILETYVEACLGASPSDVTNFYADGADGSSFSSDTYIGFRFDYAGNRYENAVSGVSNTQVIATVTALDTTPPSINSVSVPSNATYGVGQNLDFTVNTSEAVTVTTGGGTPSIALRIGSQTRQASYVSGSGTTALLFRYTVQSGDTDSDGITVGALSANGGTLQDGALNNMTLTLNSVGSTTSVLVDTTVPAVTLTSDAANPQTGPFTLTVTFSEPVTGFAAGDITVGNGTLGTLSGSGASYTIMVTPAQMGTPVVISVAAGVAQDAANNPNTAATNLTVSTGSPSSAFAAAADQIRQVLAEEATRNLRSVIGSNQRMSREARERFIAAQGGEAEGDVSLDVEGGVDTTDTVISSKGTFFGKTGLGAGKSRLVFGDFDVQHDSETGSSTATLNGKVAWETVVSDKMTLGYFVGGELARSNIMGSFEGNQNRVGLSVGGYSVEKFAENVYLDGFFSLGAGRNNLTMSNGTLDLDSDYTTRTATLGAALSAVVEQKGFEIWPELSFSYGRTWLGNIGFTGTAYSMTDNTLSLDAGTVTLANIMFRPEFRVPMDGLSGAKSLQVFTFAPRLICEQITTTTDEENCGGGAELGLSVQSENGLSNVSATIMADRLGGRTSSSMQVNIEHRF